MKHKVSGLVCAVKCIEKQKIITLNKLYQLEEELTHMYRMNHRNIVKIYGHCEDETNVYLIIEFCSKGNLNDILKERSQSSLSRGSSSSTNSSSSSGS